MLIDHGVNWGLLGGKGSSNNDVTGYLTRRFPALSSIQSPAFKGGLMKQVLRLMILSGAVVIGPSKAGGMISWMPMSSRSDKADEVLAKAVACPQEMSARI